ncbi:hypothetical protein H2203_003334 [Taxawa tesnikishii (nom. ined.)]|nr:hypothetical protein H2203_003334 [Dothideales sp. JES 119]
MARNKTEYSSSEADGWAAHVDNYIKVVEPLTRGPTEALVNEVDKLLPFTGPDVRVLDNGSGTGLLASYLAAKYPEVPIVAADISSGMLENLEKKAEKKGWKAVETKTIDALDLQSLADNPFSHVLSTFMLGSISSPLQGVQEMYKVTKPGGILGIAVWDHNIVWSDVWRETIRRSQNKPFYEPPLIFDPSMCYKDTVEKTLKGAGWDDAEVSVQQTYYAPWDSADAACDFFWNGKNPIVEMFVRGWEDNVEQIKPVLRQVYEELYGSGKHQGCPTIQAIAWKR